jgi:hypothetical protein
MASVARNMLLSDFMGGSIDPILRASAMITEDIWVDLRLGRETTRLLSVSLELHAV